jgi:DNA-binding MarR family transcriptional regulator
MDPALIDILNIPESDRTQLIRQVLTGFRIIFKSAQDHSRWVEKQCGASSPQVWALFEIERHPGWRVTDLANAMSLHQSTVSNLLEKLETKGLIRRERDAEDQRAQQLFLTKQGQKLLQHAPQPAMSLLPDTLNKLSDEILRSLGVSINEIVVHLRKHDSSDGMEPINRY